MTSCQSVGNTYYISASSGDDAASGLSEGAAWKSFKNVNSTVLKEGDRVLLKRGDVWNERLEIYGGGTDAHPVTVSAYGDKKAMKPQIKLANGVGDICLLISDCRYAQSDDENGRVNSNSHLVVEEIDLRNAYVGILVRESLLSDNEGLVIRNCDISEIWCDEMMAPLATKNGGTVAKMKELGDLPKGNIPKINKNTMIIEPTGGGAGEWLLATAVRFTGTSTKIFTGVELYNLVMENAIVGIEGIRMDDVYIHDVVNTGSYGGVVRFSAGCTGVRVERARLMSGSETYTFFGGTCGGFFGDVQHSYIKNTEFAYEYNLDENDGCGFDFEYDCEDIVFANNVLHHNDSGGILFMQLPEGKTHKHIVLENNLFYGNLRNPKNSGYNYDIILYNKKGEDTISLIGNRFFTPERAKRAKAYAWGNLGEQGYIGDTVLKDNVAEYLAEYRTRFSFNSDVGNGFVANKGDFTVANGVGTLTADGGTGAIQLTVPINGFCYNRLAVKVNEGSGSLYVQYRDSEGVKTSETKKVDREGIYLIDLSDKPISSVIEDVVLVFKPSQNGGKIAFDYLQFIPDLGVKAEKESDGAIKLTFTGKCFPILSLSPEASDISIAGYTVKSVEKLNYNTLRVNVAEKVENVKGLKMNVKSGLFIEYFGAIIDGLDCDRTAADDAALTGGAPQELYLNCAALVAE